MSHRCPGLRPVALVLVLFLGPAVVSAEDRLRVPTLAASTAAAADWASTYYGLAHFQLREVNPILRPLQSRPGRMVSVGAVMDAGLISAWNLSVGRRHERVAVTGLWALTAFRTYLVFHNLRNTKRVARRTPAAPVEAGLCVVPLHGPACSGYLASR